MSDYELAREVCRENGANWLEVRGPRKFSRLYRVRKKIVDRLRGLGRSLPEIGRLLGGRHHTTILWMSRGGRRK